MTHPVIAKRNELLGASVVKALTERGFEAYYCKTKEEAAKKAVGLIPEGSSVAWGGSVTVDQLGIKDMLRGGNYALIDRDMAETPEERMEMMRQGLTCDVFLTGTNALSEDGQLVNIDGNGNRMAAMIFGPKSVIVTVGINKVVRTAEDALTRARTVAAPTNTQRFDGLETPCRKTGECGDCKSKDCICTYIVTTRMSKPRGRIKVILVGEELGF